MIHLYLHNIERKKLAYFAIIFWIKMLEDACVIDATYNYFLVEKPLKLLILSEVFKCNNSHR